MKAYVEKNRILIGVNLLLLVVLCLAVQSTVASYQVSYSGEPKEVDGDTTLVKKYIHWEREARRLPLEIFNASSAGCDPQHPTLDEERLAKTTVAALTSRQAETNTLAVKVKSYWGRELGMMSQFLFQRPKHFLKASVSSDGRAETLYGNPYWRAGPSTDGVTPLGFDGLIDPKGFQFVSAEKGRLGHESVTILCSFDTGDINEVYISDRTGWPIARHHFPSLEGAEPYWEVYSDLRVDLPMDRADFDPLYPH